MAIYLIDSSMFSQFMERNPRAALRLRETAAQHDILICPIVRGEICHGLTRMPQGKRRRDLEATATNLFDRIPCESIPPEAGDTYAALKYDTEKRGKSIGENDLWIASMAILLGAILVTSDTDFSRVNGLKMEDWTQ